MRRSWWAARDRDHGRAGARVRAAHALRALCAGHAGRARADARPLRRAALAAVPLRAVRSGRLVAGRVLVTGADGFVGGHLSAALGAAAAPLEADVLDRDAVAEAVRRERPDAVVHLAAQSSVGRSWADAADTWTVNVVGTVNVLEAVAAEQPSARVLFASTGEVYGNAARIPTPEDEPVAPVSPYAASKAAAEIACGQAARGAGLDVVVTRAFNHEGPGRDERFAVGSWAQQIAPARGRGRRHPARRRPHRRARPDRRARRLPRLPAAARPRRPGRHLQRRLRPRRLDAVRAGAARRAGCGADHGRGGPDPSAPGRDPAPGRRCGQAAGRDRLEAADPARADPARHARAARARPCRSASRERPPRADHRHHRPGRLVPRRAAAREGLRGLGHDAPRLDREPRAHRAPDRPDDADPGRPARPALAGGSRCARRSRTRSTTSPRRASSRPRGTSRC